MDASESLSAVREMIAAFDLADPDVGVAYYRALVADEAFAAARYRYRNAVAYARHDHATRADREARDALERAVKAHAQRVEGQIDG
jgi:hypothetical protein